MKKIYSLIIIILTIICLTGCSEQSKDKFNDLFDGMDTGAREYIYEYSEEDKNNSLSLLNDVNEFDVTNSTLNNTIIFFNEFYLDYIYVSEQHMVMLVYSYIFPTNKSILEELSSIMQIQLDFTQQYSKLLLDIYESELSNEFFKDFSDSDIDYLEYQRDNFDEEYYSFQSQLSTIEMEYTELLNTDNVTDAQLANKYIELVNINNKIARKLKFNNYMEYAYEVQYQRAYSYSDLTHITDAVKNDLIPHLGTMLGSIQNDLSNLGFAALTWQGIFSSNFNNYKSNLDSLANYMGGDYLAHYNYLWNNGEYYFGNEDSNAGAFIASITDKQIAYFGPSPYNSLFTVTHEFGHYAAGREDIKDGQRNLLDLAEFQAQANELMLASYMSQQNNSALYDAVAKYKLFECSTNTIVSAVVNDFEYEIYTTTNLQTNDVTNIMKNVLEQYEYVIDGEEILSTLFGDLTNIWMQTAAASPGYYISYGMSLFPSLQHFFVTEDNLATAKSKYFGIMTGGSDLFQVLYEIGYDNPLQSGVVSELFIDIKNYIEN